MIIGIGGNNTSGVISEIIQTDLSLFGAILSVSPYYNKPSQQGIYPIFQKLQKLALFQLLFTMYHQELVVQ